MDSRTGLIAVAIIGVTIACGTRIDVPAAPTAVDGNTSTRGRLPPPSPPASSGNCNAAKAQFAVGERASQELLEKARAAAGAGVARFIRPNEPITLEFSPARLDLSLNGQDIVQSVYCG